MEKLLQMSHVDKAFAQNKVLQDVEFNLYPGEVHALIGENGAGKSTLMKILMGVYQADGGTIVVKGREQMFHTPTQALNAGIAMIHQELSPIPDLSIAENIFVGRELHKWGIVDQKKQHKLAIRYLEQLGVSLNPATLMRNLSVSELQMVEISKTISYGARIIIMDEPTSAITETEVQKLFASIRYLQSQGIGIIYISHKMDELFEISQRITVLRDGRRVGTVNTPDITRRQIISMMVGRELSDIYPHHGNHPGKPVLSVEHLTRKGCFRDVSFQLRQGEKLGIAGLMGAGRTELVMTIFGALQKDSGGVCKEGQPLEITRPWHAIRQGIALISEDRKLYGLNLLGSVRDNAVSVIEKKICRWGFLFRGKVADKKAREMIHTLNIKITAPSQLVGSLSGGNQQKVVLAKWLLNQPDILIFDEPTRGIDIGAKVEIYKLIDSLAQEGKSIIIISSEMPEIIGLCNRILVMHEGTITGELTGDEILQENIMALASGIVKGEA